ncbi:colicin E3/pyocin S6 family cytotoxin [Salinarimonas sp.]|uniref:colicin E3/pyocin S6 family cytotoxin n=1 Tax=Salinarimonas sp. TaxID=2766526 RepID=UPI0035B50974
MAYIPPPNQLRGFPRAHKVRPKTVMDDGRKRRRWRDDDRIYEWDYQHGRVEVYDHRGRHQGEADPDTGKLITPPDPTRRIEP